MNRDMGRVQNEVRQMTIYTVCRWDVIVTVDRLYTYSGDTIDVRRGKNLIYNILFDFLLIQSVLGFDHRSPLIYYTGTAISVVKLHGLRFRQ